MGPKTLLARSAKSMSLTRSYVALLACVSRSLQEADGCVQEQSGRVNTTVMLLFKFRFKRTNYTYLRPELLRM